METVEMGLEVEYAKVPYKENYAIIEKTGPYNMFRVYLERGQTPDYFKHAVFTSYDLAARSVRDYLEAKAKLKDK